MENKEDHFFELDVKNTAGIMQLVLAWREEKKNTSHTFFLYKLLRNSYETSVFSSMIKGFNKWWYDKITFLNWNEMTS